MERYGWIGSEGEAGPLWAGSRVGRVGQAGFEQLLAQLPSCCHIPAPLLCTHPPPHPHLDCGAGWGPRKLGTWILESWLAHTWDGGSGVRGVWGLRVGILPPSPASHWRSPHPGVWPGCVRGRHAPVSALTTLLKVMCSADSVKSMMRKLWNRPRREAQGSRQDPEPSDPWLPLSSVGAKGCWSFGRAVGRGPSGQTPGAQPLNRGSEVVTLPSESVAKLSTLATTLCSYSLIWNLFPIAHRSIPEAHSHPPWLLYPQNKEAVTVLTAPGMVKQCGRDLKYKTEAVGKIPVVSLKGNQGLALALWL